MILWKKIWRDMMANKMAYMACIFVIAIGLLSYTALSTAKDNLYMAKDAFYQDYAMADGFIELRNAPLQVVQLLQDMPGIKEVEGRLVKEVRVLSVHDADNVFLKLISLHQPNGNVLNNVQLVTGSFPKKHHRQIVLAHKFYEANQLQVGQPLEVMIEGKKVEWTISGSGQSPEFVYTLQNLQSLTPDPKTYEVAYVPYEDMEVLFQQPNMINHLSFTLQPGIKFEDVEQKIQDELQAYGVIGFYAVKDQISNAMLMQELEQLEKMAFSIPVVFLSIAGIILYIMLKRLVESQRGQIGAMKAFGYSKWRILVHYMNYGTIIGVIGGVIGGVLGHLCSTYLMEMYQDYFSLPNLASQFTPAYFFIGLLLTVSFCIFASFQGVRTVLKLQPAEAMLQSAPLFVKESWMEHIPSVWQLFTVQGRMAVRNIVRNKTRSVFTYIGIMLTFSMMASFFSLGTMAEVMVLEQFTKVQTQDVKMHFTKPMPQLAVVREVQRVKGVHLVEPLIEIPVTLQHTYHQQDVIAIGIQANAWMYNVYDQTGQKIEVPSSGMILSEQIADKLQVEVGDIVQLDSPYAKDEHIRVVVKKVIPQYIGANIYMEQQALLDVLKQPNIATSLLISLDDRNISEWKKQYVTSSMVGQIEVRKQMVDKYAEFMELTAVTLSVMAVIAVLTGFAIVYNASIIALAERQRELASLRVLGMTAKEVMAVISVEQWLIGVASMISGVPLAIIINQTLSKSMSSDLFTLPATTTTSAMLQACMGTMLAIFISQQVVARKVKRLNLVSVLKERE